MGKSSKPPQQPRVCFTSPWVDVIAVPTGAGSADEHFVVTGKDYVSIVATLPDGQVLLVRQFRPAVGAETIETPAGHVEPGQTPEEAARQELLEETGYRARTVAALGVLYPDTGRLGNRHWAFFATDLERVGDPAEHEVAKPFSVTPGELREMTLAGRFCHAQSVAAVHLAVTAGMLVMPPAARPVKKPTGRFVPRQAAKHDVCVIGGCGHVGLPLSLVMAQAGMRVLVYDINESALAAVAGGRMPFMEDGAEPLLRDALDAGKLAFLADAAAFRGVPNLIVTIGTPVDEFLNADTGVIRRWIEGFAPHVSDDQLIMLRSTLYPGTTDWLARHLQRLGKKPRIAFCPERIVQGKAIDELPLLPQIVSGTTRMAEDAAADFWSLLAPEIVRMAPIEAEFAKLFCNAYRYIQFATANQFFMITSDAGVDFGRVLRGLKEHYPRMRDFPSAGFAAGPCLLKDTMQLAAFAQNRFTLGHAAMQINEGLALWLVSELARTHDLRQKTVGLLGMAFKADIDDTRASLSYKLKKTLAFHCRDVLTADPYVTDDPDLVPTDEVIRRSDLLILCVPHSIWRGLDTNGKPLVDIWGAGAAPPAPPRS
jgi:UDP-N-acetyl-D-mannosaminuronic acid dehydrogenase